VILVISVCEGNTAYLAVLTVMPGSPGQIVSNPQDGPRPNEAHLGLLEFDANLIGYHHERGACRWMLPLKPEDRIRANVGATK